MELETSTPVLLSLKDFELEAKKLLLERNQSRVWTYLASGSLEDETISENKAAFGNLRIRPRVMKDVSSIDATTKVLNSPIRIPIGISPSALQKVWHPQAELATAIAAESVGAFIILSSASSYTIEEVAASAPNAVKWLQMSPPNKSSAELEIAIDLIRRAQEAGFSAIVFTLDHPVLPLRYSATRARFNYVNSGCTAGNFKNYPAHQVHETNTLEWSDFEWIKKLTTLPIVVKGILTREDAGEAVRAGVDGILVSNHGGRQLDGGPATIEALPEIVDEVRGRVEIYLDGGVRSGKDVFKALALGARAVLIGRPAPWGLIVKGQEGVEEILEILKKELVTIMGQAGCTSLAEINRKHVAHKLQYALQMTQFLQ